MEIKNWFLVICTILLTSCSSELTVNKINCTAKKHFKKDVRQLKKSNKQFTALDEDASKALIDQEVYFFERKIEIRNKVIDSLNLLKKEKVLIIDLSKDNNGQRVESSYFFFDDKIIFVWFDRLDKISNGEVFVKFVPKIENVTKEHLEKNQRDILLVYNNLSRSNPPTLIGGGMEHISCLVTMVQDKKVSYYSVSGAEKYKVVKLE